MKLYGGRYFVALCLVVMMLGGCAVLDAIFGVKPDGTSDGGAAAAAAPWLNTVIPGAGAVLTGLGGIYAAIRGRQWKRAALSTFQTINAVAGTELGQEAAGKLKERLASAHDKAGVAGFVEKALDTIEGPLRTHAPEQPTPTSSPPS